MAGPVELLIVAGAFGIVGVYLYIVSRFIREAEAGTKQMEASTRGNSR
jgi:hypothetical protein